MKFDLNSKMLSSCFEHEELNRVLHFGNSKLCLVFLNELFVRIILLYFSQATFYRRQLKHFICIQIVFFIQLSPQLIPLIFRASSNATN